MGRNGAGKTTLLKALMGVLPKTGTVHLLGVDISRWPGHRINAAGMVWVPQEDSVFPGLTVREHLVIALNRSCDGSPTLSGANRHKKTNSTGPHANHEREGSARRRESPPPAPSSRSWLTASGRRLRPFREASGRCWVWRRR